MNFSRLLLLGVAAASIVGCGSSSDSSLVAPDPAGLVRFINAVPDTGAMDFRFTDAVEGVPSTPFVNLRFRDGFDRAYQRVNIGTHHIRVFMGSANIGPSGGTNDPAVVSTVMGDTTFTFAQGAHYTFVFYGSARAGTQKFLIVTDPLGPPPAGNFSLRAANFTAVNQEVYVNSGTTTLTTVSGSANWNVGPLGVSDYGNFTLAPAGSNYVVSSADAGTVTPVRSTLMPVGVAAVAAVPGVSPDLAAIAGSRVGGVLSAYIFPASTTGSQALAFATPGIVLQVDKQP
jgi:hypothetical protein